MPTIFKQYNKHRESSWAIALLLVIMTISACANREIQSKATSSTLSADEKQALLNPAATVKSAIGAPRDYTADWMSLEKWFDLHKEDVAVANQGEVDLLFIGDSITQGWPQDLLAEAFPGFTIGNFGIGGDLTENLVWRLENGGTGALQPQLVVQLIGINNFWDDPSAPAFIMEGIKRNTEILLSSFPSANIMLLGLLPADLDKLSDRSLINKLNQMIEFYAKQNPRTHYRYQGDVFVDEDSKIRSDLMPDNLHPNRQGYIAWLDILKQDIEALLK